MEKNYVISQEISNALCSDSDRARIAEERYERFHGRRDDGYNSNDSGGCLGSIIMFVVATFGIGGIFFFV